ncbi:hypothetical protein CRE_19983 [Caenorhabditis remanei]|uniref:Uncharacterized protein n=1 Tax=Caenorhabditis remanei TaxID=31234 RepID=E3N8H9_CAERE|nr:hypothetical protein CRE_19982 [Caenorhabditis remanei]EFO89447.1 hypothetical protein CRE_19983 [Caenorhabditis remanei]
MASNNNEFIIEMAELFRQNHPSSANGEKHLNHQLTENDAKEFTLLEKCVFIIFGVFIGALLALISKIVYLVLPEVVAVMQFTGSDYTLPVVQASYNLPQNG